MDGQMDKGIYLSVLLCGGAAVSGLLKLINFCYCVSVKQKAGVDVCGCELETLGKWTVFLV